MENRDFRDRLRGHKTAPNPEAWDQMSMLLDSTEKPSKKKRFFLWPFLLGLFTLLSMGLGIWYFYTPAPVDSERLSSLKVEKGLQEYSDKDKKATTAPPSSTSSAYDKETKISTSTTVPAVSLEEKPHSTPTDSRSGTLTTAEATNSSAVSTFARGSGTESDMQQQREVQTQAMQSVSDATQQPSLQSPSRSVTTTNVQTELKDAAGQSTPVESELPRDQTLDSSSGQTSSKDAQEGSPPMAANNATEAPAEDIADILPAKEVSPLLSTTALRFLDINERAVEGSSITKVPRPTPFHLMLHGGYASVNNSKGIILGGGLIYDVDRIIGLEISSNFSYGTEQGVPAGELRTREYQIDLAALIHLYFVNNRRHKLSFDFGTGYSHYNLSQAVRRDDGPDEIRLKVNTGRHLQGRLSYQYAIRPDQWLGLQFGVLSYDDAVSYLSLKYVTRL